jgi:hypothetical protein
MLGGRRPSFRRRVPWGSILAANLAITAFFVYGLISVGWSDYPWTALKRFTKVVEHLVMVLVVLDRSESHAGDGRAVQALPCHRSGGCPFSS